MLRASQGCGTVPALPLVQAATKQLGELPTKAMVTASGLKYELDLTAEGLTPQQLRDFFAVTLEASAKKDPIVETGNKYGVSDDFHRMNSQLLMREVEGSATCAALSPADRARWLEFLEVVLCNSQLRSRNPLHPSVIDSCVIGNLINFPKHIFGMPFGCYATDGNEALSLVLYSYRQQHAARRKSKRAASAAARLPVVLYVASDGERRALDLTGLAACAERIGMDLAVVEESSVEASMREDGSALACVMAGFSSAALPAALRLAASHGVGVHVHVRDAEWRQVFTAHDGPVHFAVPAGVRSLSLEEGLLQGGYALYRDLSLRDLHFDVALAWQTAYLSPNEGGSGASTPLYVDFCTVMLGWSAMRDLAAAAPSHHRKRGGGAVATLAPTRVPPQSKLAAGGGLGAPPTAAQNFDELVAWAGATMDDARVGRPQLEQHLLGFQRHFLGGLERPLEVVSTGGGTRSINVAFEAVLRRAKAERLGIASYADVRVITGNPHLAVERAERRFGFELVRLYDAGALSVARLAEEVRHPSVCAVYSQTLSYTDGTSDDVGAILEVIEAENARRSLSGAPLVSLINDCCLAFCVLVHNDGGGAAARSKRGRRRSLRLLDLSAQCMTPCLVTLDAHKHLGTDKGVSTCVGTPGTLAHLDGAVRVGAQPSNAMLVRALADMMLVGVEGYQSKYATLARRMGEVEAAVEAAGLTVFNGHHRAAGSSVIGVEDEAGVMARKLKKCGHTVHNLYNLHPAEPRRIQYGWSLSLTPYALRTMGDGRAALDVFIADLAVAAEAVHNQRTPLLARLFAPNSLLGIMTRGGTSELWLFRQLWYPGVGRAVATVLLRRLFSRLLDAGIARSAKRPNPLGQLACVLLAAAALLAAAMLYAIVESAALACAALLLSVGLASRGRAPRLAAKPLPPPAALSRGSGDVAVVSAEVAPGSKPRRPTTSPARRRPARSPARR